MASTGNLKDTYDIRDLSVIFRPVTPAPPSRIDLRTLNTIHVYHQGAPPTCTAHAVASAFEIIQNTRHPGNTFMPSRSFLYYNTRLLEGTHTSITGTSIRNCIKTLASTGACNEVVWPYDTTRLTVKPPATAYTQAPLNRITRYARLTLTLAQIKLCLFSGHPFVFGMKCYDHWYKAVGGAIPATIPTTARSLGGHAMMCVGYDDTRQVVIVLNSWGATWGDKGYAYIPYSLFLRVGEVYDPWVLFGVTVPPTATIA